MQPLGIFKYDWSLGATEGTLPTKEHNHIAVMSLQMQCMPAAREALT
jgi:hypothetical protein